MVVGRFGDVDLGNLLRRLPAEPPTVELTQRFAGLFMAPGKGISGHQECATETTNCPAYLQISVTSGSRHRSLAIRSRRVRAPSRESRWIDHRDQRLRSHDVQSAAPPWHFPGGLVDWLLRMRRGEAWVEPSGPIHRLVSFLMHSLDAADKAFGIPGLRHVRVNLVRFRESFSRAPNEVLAGSYLLLAGLVPPVLVVTDITGGQLAPSSERAWIEAHLLLQS